MGNSGSGNSGAGGSGAGGSGSVGSGNSGIANSGAANTAASGSPSGTGHSGGTGVDILARFRSGSPLDPASPESLPLAAAVGIMLIGGVALGPTFRRQGRLLKLRSDGAHFSRPL
jgi:hypothetical protein